MANHDKRTFLSQGPAGVNERCAGWLGMESESGLNERTTKQGTRPSGDLGDREERLPARRKKIDVGPRRARPLAPRHHPAPHHRGDGLTKMVRPRPPSAARTDAVRSAVRRAATRENQGETRENHGKPANRFRTCRPRSPRHRENPRSPLGRGVGFGARSHGPAQKALFQARGRTSSDVMPTATIIMRHLLRRRVTGGRNQA